MTIGRSRQSHNGAKRTREKRLSTSDRRSQRQLLLEKLEDRRLLAAGPRLAGVLPNNSVLFSFEDANANVRNVAPRELKVRFDEDQQINALTLDAISVTRSGGDGVFGAVPVGADGADVQITPGHIGVTAAPDENEVVIRFAESLPDDIYHVEIFGAGSVAPLLNTRNEAYVPTLNDGDGDPTKDTIRFELDLGPQVLAVVPQPVSRDATGAIVQARDTIEVYFNDDDLFVENDDFGRPTARSAENPDFYQLIFTADTVRNTDDVIVKPVSVDYDPVTNRALLTFAQDLDELEHPVTGENVGPGNFRLRIGTSEAAPLAPLHLAPRIKASTDFNSDNETVVQFTAVRPDEQDISILVVRNPLGVRPTAPAVRVNAVANTVFLDLNSTPGHEATAEEVVAAINLDPVVSGLITASLHDSSQGAVLVGNREINYSPIRLSGIGSSFDNATDLSDDTDLGAVITITGAGSAFVDGGNFQITDSNGQTRKFELDADEPPSINDASAIRVPFRDSLSQAEMGTTIVDAINAASFGVTAELAGNKIRLEGDSFVDLGAGVDGLRRDFQNRFDNGQVLQVVRGGDGFDGNTTTADSFTIIDQLGLEQRFEFDNGFFLDVPDGGSNISDGEQFSISFNNTPVNFEFENTLIGDGVLVATNIQVDFTPADDQAALTAAVVAAIQSKVDDGSLPGVQPLDLGGGRIHLGGSTLHDVRSRYIIPVPADGNAAVDGETFSIQFDDEVNPPVETVFEYVDTDVRTGPSVGSDFAINFTTASLQSDLAMAIRAAILNVPQVNPVDLGGRIDIGGTTFHAVITSTTTGIDHAGVPGPTAVGAIAIPLVPDVTLTATEIARLITDAVNSSSLAVTATASGNSIQLDGEQSVEELDGITGLRESIAARFDAGPVLVVTDDAVSALPDEATFVLRDDRGTEIIFEVDRDGTQADPNARPITLAGGETRDQIAQIIVVAIKAADFRLDAVSLGDRIYLTNDRDVRISSAATGLEATSQGLVISSQISARPFALDFPGNEDEPGHRDIPDAVGGGGEQHINEDFGAGGRDSTPGVTTVLYNFRSDFALSPEGTQLQNAITDGQRQRARDAFALWSKDLGVQFIETAEDGLTIATGDLRALDPSTPNVLDYSTNDFRVRVDPTYSDGLLVMNGTLQWNDDFGGDWFINSMIGIGSMLGLNRANDLPGSTLLAFQSGFSFLNDTVQDATFPSLSNPTRGHSVTNNVWPISNLPTPEPIFPGNFDILHGQHLYRPDGVDLDLYRFTIDVDSGREGLFTAETFAERLPNASLLDTELSLYRENPDGTRQLIARNDDYFSRDSYIELDLDAGVYYIGVAASGNADFDPTIEDTGIGGTSQGSYDLRLNFRAQVDNEDAIRDADLTPTRIDGDLDGVPGGVYNFWFQTRSLNRVLTVTGNGSDLNDGQVLTLTNSQGVVRNFEFDSNNSIRAGNTRINFGPNDSATDIAQRIASSITGEQFGIGASASGNSVLLGDPNTQLNSEREISLSFDFDGIEIEGRTIFVDKLAGPNADGSLDRPFNNIARNGITNAFEVAQPNDIVRIVGNGGVDGDIDSVGDNFAYEIGFGTLPLQILSDGTEMAVPRGTTVMVEPGTNFKMRRSRVGVGSSSLTVDRSGGALQLLGTPDRRVIFTSWLDETIGRDTHPPTTQPGRGDWGGIVFRADIDREESRPNLEDQGIFLNYVNHAEIFYGGGGNVVIDSIQQVVNPIQMIQTRPTISFNRILHSADSAMSASPNSFDETNFHSPRFQSNGEFTSDYARIGPDIHGNFLLENSTNGLFIRIETPTGEDLRPLTVAGRFDDTDVVHVLSENLVIQGSQGEPFLDLSRPAVDLVTFSPVNTGTLVAGTYSYKVTFVDVNGFEGRPSFPTSSFTVSAASEAAGLRAIRLNQLPPADGDFVARRVYRTDDPANGTYQLVAQLNASDSAFTDDGSLIGDVLRRDAPLVDNVTLTVQPRGSLGAGAYNYRVVFVDASGQGDASSDPTETLIIAGAPNGGGIQIDNLPIARDEFVARRIYRSSVGGVGPYELVAEIDPSSRSYFDDGFTTGGVLDPSAIGVIRARPHARLAIDPGTVLKMEGSRIETRFGGQLLAEGIDGQEVIITSRLDDSFGAGGTFDTNDDDDRGVDENVPTPGDWGGLYFGPLGILSLDHALIAFGGGTNKIEGTTKGFNVIELHQANARITNSIIEKNANGVEGQGPLDRFGRGFNLPATIFVRGSQPIIVDNIIRDNVNPDPLEFNPANGLGARTNAAITVNLNSLTADPITDVGRSRGTIGLIDSYGDNRGPLVRGNRLENNGLNGMVVRGEELSAQSVWDDTDIVHIVTDRYDDARFGWLFDEIYITDLHTFGGVRLQSSPSESLVVKLEDDEMKTGQRYNLNPTNGAGFTATGDPLEITDRIGGILHVIGQPGFPVVLTSIHDDTVGAGLRPGDLPQIDTNNNGIATTPNAGDWRSIRLDQHSHDRNVEIITEREPANETAPGRNATTNSAQFLGELAADEKSGDGNLRMGFEIQGFLNEPNDIDVYSFTGIAGTEAFIDIDRTTFALDTVLELLDANGVVLARSNDTLGETDEVEFIDDSLQPNLVNPLQRSPTPYTPTHISGLPRDAYSTNPRDAGMRVSLPGNAGSRSSYHLRVRSDKGLTTGVYQLQVRVNELDEFPGSTVRFADIRYAQNGIEVLGHPAHSPLLGEASEDEEVDPGLANNNSFLVDPLVPGRRPQDLGNLFSSDRGVFSIGGSLSDGSDVDFYNFDVRYENISERSLHHASLVFDLDYADGLNRANTSLAVFDGGGRLVFVGRDSNIAEDQPGPLAGSDLVDLSRGSIGFADPFIGPVEVQEGKYFVAVTSVDRTPSELINNPLLRLEPINSLVRIAEDHIGSFGGSTANDPLVTELLDPTFIGTGTNLWHVTSNRDTDPGHGINQAHDLSRGGTDGGDSFYFGDTSGTVPTGSIGELLSNPFSLQDYSAADLPVLYFNYFVQNDANVDAFRVFVVDNTGTETLLASSNTTEAADPAVTPLSQTGPAGWLQARLDLSAVANMDDLRLRFDYEAVSGGAEGAYVDDVIIGFAERGEMVTGSTGTPTFVGDPNAPAGQVLSGDYQLEIRKAPEYGTSGSTAIVARDSTVWGIQPGTQQIVQIDPTTGAIVGGFSTPDDLQPFHQVAGLSLAEGGRSLIYVNDATNRNILYRLDPATGSLLSAENLPDGASQAQSTLFRSRGGLSYQDGTIFALDNGFTVDAQSGFSGPLSIHYTVPFGADFPGAVGGDDQGREFTADVFGTIYEHSPNNPEQTLNSFPVPAGSALLSGLGLRRCEPVCVGPAGQSNHA